jgi:electron transfer flavoprotein alpha subunit
MAEVIAIAECSCPELLEGSLELVTVARRVSRSVAVVVVSAAARSFVPELSRKGVGEVLLAQPSEAELNPEFLEYVIEQLVALERPRLVLFGHTMSGMSVAPALAARLEASFAADVVDLRIDGDQLIAVRELYGGRTRAEFELERPMAIATIRPGAFAPAAEPGAPAVRDLSIGIDPNRIRSVPLELIDASGEREDDLHCAAFLLAIGRGIAHPENIAEFEDLADTLGARLVVSGPLVSAGWASPSQQIGQSGKKVRPRVYLAMGISGAAEHVAGVRDAGRIIAVNEDRDAPIFRVAHYGAVADIFEVAKELMTGSPYEPVQDDC